MAITFAGIFKFKNDYIIHVVSEDGTSAESVTGDFPSAIERLGQLAVIQIAADAPNPTPGKVVRGGKKPKFKLCGRITGTLADGANRPRCILPAGHYHDCSADGEES